MHHIPSLTALTAADVAAINARAVEIQETRLAKGLGGALATFVMPTPTPWAEVQAPMNWLGYMSAVHKLGGHTSYVTIPCERAVLNNDMFEDEVRAISLCGCAFIVTRHELEVAERMARASHVPLLNIANGERVWQHAGNELFVCAALIERLLREE